MKAGLIKQCVIKPVLLAVAAAFLLQGCSKFGYSNDDGSAQAVSSQSTVAEGQPYYPTDFNDLLIPNELQWNLDNSMYIRTDSFVGGVLNFNGNVDINSLTDFFINSMQNNHWKLISSAKYKKTLLAFTKPNKNCIITIAPTELIKKADVYIYITENMGQQGSFRRPTSEPIY